MPTAKRDPQLHPGPHIIGVEGVSNLNPFLNSRLVCLSDHLMNPLKRLWNIGTIAVASSLVSMQPSSLLSTLCSMTLEKYWTSLVFNGIISGGTGRHYWTLWAERGTEQRPKLVGHPISQPRIRFTQVAALSLSLLLHHPFLSPRPQTRHLESDETDLALDTPKSTPYYCYLKEIKITRRVEASN